MILLIRFRGMEGQSKGDSPKNCIFIYILFPFPYLSCNTYNLKVLISLCDVQISQNKQQLLKKVLTTKPSG